MRDFGRSVLSVDRGSARDADRTPVLMHLLAPVLSDMEQWVSSNAFLKVLMHLLALGAF